MSTNSQVHFVLQGKGGVGKSLIASVITQYFAATNGSVRAYDTDPVNDTFSQYKGCNAHRVNLMTQANQINSRVFDSMVEDIVATDEICVVDNGASTFVPLMAYMIENQVVDMLQAGGKSVYVHSVLTGGQAFNDTMQGLDVMLKSVRVPVVVWTNQFFGPISEEGKNFTDSALYKDYKDRIKGVVDIAKGNSDTFGKDVELMIKAKMTFDEGISSSDFGLMSRQRLKIVKGSLFEQLDAIRW